MSETRKNSMAAVLSIVLRVIFWIAVIVGALSLALLSLGLIGSLNGGEIAIPGAKAVAGNVPVGQFVASIIYALLSFTTIAYVCYHLRDILETLAKGDPFVPENGPRLLRIALAMGAMEILRILALALVGASLDMGTKIGSDAEYVVSIMPNLALWGAILVLLILAQVFKEGTRLREEEKMTI